MATTTKRQTYKPMEFEWALEAFSIQNRLHWIASEISLLDDLHEFNNELSEHERNVATQVMRFFTQSDIEIASSYLDYYISYLSVYRNQNDAYIFCSYGSKPYRSLFLSSYFSEIA